MYISKSLKKFVKFIKIDQRERNQKKPEVYGNNDNSKHRDRFKKSLNKVKIHQSMHIENVLKQPYFRT